MIGKHSLLKGVVLWTPHLAYLISGQIRSRDSGARPYRKQ